LIQAIRSQTDLAEFLLENGFFFKDFTNMEIVDELYYTCQHYDIIALLNIYDPPTYSRDEISFCSQLDSETVTIKSEEQFDNDIVNDTELNLKKENKEELNVTVDTNIIETIEDEDASLVLQNLYDDANSFLVTEKEIIKVFNSQNIINSWTNVYDFLTSLFYVIIIQLSFVKQRKALRYLMLRNLGAIAEKIKKEYEETLNLDDREKCLNNLKSILRTLYCVKEVKRLARDFSITSYIDEQGNILRGIKDKTEMLMDDTSDDEGPVLAESDVVVLRIVKW
jgi:hypothetical protein